MSPRDRVDEDSAGAAAQGQEPSQRSPDRGGTAPGPPLRVLLVTSEWPTAENPTFVPFLVEQVEALREAGIVVEVFSFRGANNPANYNQARRRLRQTWDLESFDLIHAHFGQSGLIVGKTPTPLVVTFHGSDLHGIVGEGGDYTLRGRLLRIASRRVARRATRVILVSWHLSSFLPIHTPFDVIPCGIDLEKFRPLDREQAREALGLPHREPLVLFASSPRNPVKRFGLAQEAVAGLPPDLQAQMLTLEGIPHERVPLFMSACDTLLMTSRHEGSPMVIKEALACNLPVVSLSVGDVAERISGIEGCTLCRSEAPRDLALALEPLLRKPRRCAGRESVADLDHPVITPRILATYRTTLALRGPGAIAPSVEPDS